MEASDPVDDSINKIVEIARSYDIVLFDPTSLGGVLEILGLREKRNFDYDNLRVTDVHESEAFLQSFIELVRFRGPNREKYGICTTDIILSELKGTAIEKFKNKGKAVDKCMRNKIPHEAVERLIRAENRLVSILQNEGKVLSFSAEEKATYNVCKRAYTGLQTVYRLNYPDINFLSSGLAIVLEGNKSCALLSNDIGVIEAGRYIARNEVLAPAQLGMYGSFLPKGIPMREHIPECITKDEKKRPSSIVSF